MVQKYESRLVIGHSNLQDLLSPQYLNYYSFLLAICLEGEAEVSFSFKKQTFAKGMVSLFSFDIYPVILSSSADFKVYYVFIQGDIGEKILYGLPSRFYSLIYINPVVKMLPSQAALWMNLFDACYQEVENPYRNQTLVSLFNAFCFFYLRILEKSFGTDKEARPSGSNSNESQLVSDFFQLLANHFREHRNIAFYADKLCITPGYLSLLVKKMEGETPKSVIDYRVVSEMKHLLLNSELNINQIAHNLNFTDVSYMCRFFRKHTGLSTSEFRKQNPS